MNQPIHRAASIALGVEANKKFDGQEPPGPPSPSQPRRGFLSRHSLDRWWSAIAIILGFYFFAWWLHLRPGVYSYDSAHYLNEVISGDINDLKPFFYARFLQAATWDGAELELAAVVQALIIVLALSRMFAIAVVTRVRGAWLVIGGLLVLNPYIANMIFYVQNDVLFSVALLVIVVETLFVVRQGSASLTSCAIIAMCAPMALLFRQNGLLFLPLWAATVLMLLPQRQWWRVVLPAAITSLVACASIVGVSRGGPNEHQDLFYPAVVHEAIGLARPGYRTDVGARLAPETRAAIGTHRLPLAVAFYWPLYWDTIAFDPGGPRLGEMSPEHRDEVVRSFLQRDLLPNVQAVFGHRMEIFLGACLARAQIVEPYSSPPNLPQEVATSKARHAFKAGGGSVLGRVNQWSMDSRGWTWNALFGVFVLGLLSIFAVWRRDLPLLLCALLLWVQAAAVFLVAPSAEYRYVFVLYLAPLLLLVGKQSADRVAAGATRDSNATKRTRGVQ